MDTAIAEKTHAKARAALGERKGDPVGRVAGNSMKSKVAPGVPAKWAKHLVSAHFNPTERPYDREVMELLLQLIGDQGYTLPAACGMLNLLPQTLDLWAVADPLLFDRIAAARLRRLATLEQGLLETSNSARVQARIFALKNADPKLWAADPEVHQTNIAANITIVTGVPEAIPAPSEVIDGVANTLLEAVAAAPDAPGGGDAHTPEADPVRADDRVQGRARALGS